MMPKIEQCQKTTIIRAIFTFKIDLRTVVISPLRFKILFGCKIESTKLVMKKEEQKPRH